MTIKVGAACKMLNEAGDPVPELNLSTTTVKKLTSLVNSDRNAWLWALVDRNLTALANQLSQVAGWPIHRRMWRIGGDILPVYTHAITRHFYGSKEVQHEIEKRLLIIGIDARKANIRLSFHPGQFVVLGSRNPGIRENSMRELIYHCDVFTMMGYVGWHPNGLAVNVHVGLKDPDIQAMRTALKGAPSNVRNFVTLENDEFSWCAARIVETFGDLVPLVLDVHHYWIHQGVRLGPTSELATRIRQTWRGVQPKLHLAMSYPELCSASKHELCLNTLIEDNNTRSGLRVHAPEPWHRGCIHYAGRFGFDIMWEGGNKNLGAATISSVLKLNQSTR